MSLSGFSATSIVPQLSGEKRRRKVQFDVEDRFQEFASSSLKRPYDRKAKENLSPSHELEINLESDTYSPEKYALFEHYQITVHKESPEHVSAAGFKRFLCSGLGQKTYLAAGGKSWKLGSYHQCYRLDGKLVAMGVLDLLPNCVSSVYLLYHKSVGDFNFGKISALNEIGLARQMGFEYYYMGAIPLFSPSTHYLHPGANKCARTGFYIHSCAKMRYKATFHPQYVLDPEDYSWHLLDKSLFSKLDTRPYVSPSREERLKAIPASAIPSDDGKYLAGDGAPTVPKDQIASGDVSLFGLDMPGIMTGDEILANLDALGEWGLQIRGSVIKTGDLADFDEEHIFDSSSLPGIAAEMAAAVGWEVVKGSRIYLG
ncbi:Arginyl-tRNA--protein transferase 1 [Agyrium rufum]|nr:Arginyl-tRNA--protein transferase 1 [Agyrium rufum]